MSIESEITRLNTAKTEILGALSELGVDVSGVTTMSDIPDRIRAIAVYPLFVDNVSKMTDSSKVYVLTTNGKIYHYVAGTGFVDTGLFYGSVPHTVSTTDLVAGESPLADGEVYLVYE